MAESANLGLVDTVADHRRGRGSRLRIDHSALLSGGIADDVELCGAGSLRAECKRGKSAANDKLPHFVYLR